MQELAEKQAVGRQHYGRPMDIEWAKTVIPVSSLLCRHVRYALRGRVMERYTLHAQGKSLPKVAPIGHRIGAGTVKVIHDIGEMNRIEHGVINFVTRYDRLEVGPIARKAAAIVTNRGGRTCHAALSPAIGHSGGSRLRRRHQARRWRKVTVSCAKVIPIHVYADI